MAIGHIKSGTKIRRKEKNRYNVRKLIDKATIAEDDLLVVMEQFTMELKPIETIVVPRDFSISVVTLAFRRIQSTSVSFSDVGTH